MNKICRVKSNNKMKEKLALQIFLSFATGELSTEDFWAKYTTDEALRNALIKDRKRNKLYKWVSSDGSILYSKFDDTICAINPDTLLETIDINSLENRYQLFVVVNRYLIERKINLSDSELNSDVKEYLFLQKMLPSWVGVKDISFLQNLVASAPKQLTASQKLEWGKSRVKELFKYTDKKPNWIQEPDWPIVDGQPLIFSHQETAQEGFEKYIFYDERTNKEVIIEQCE